MRFSKLTVLAATAATVAFAPAAQGADYPLGFEQEPVVEGLTRPTMVAWAPDGRMFVAEKDGALKVVTPGSQSAEQIANYSARVNHFSDRGLLGLAVDSQFAQYPYLYLLYSYDLYGTDSGSPMVSQLMRVRVNSANQVTEQTVILGTDTSGPCPTATTVDGPDCIPADGTSHSIGTVRSAPDGTLWVGNGDAADYGRVDPLALRAYNDNSMAGKLMHIDRDGRGLSVHPFCPANTDLADVCTKIHAKGFRNPFRFTQRPGGGIALGDVGWNTWEELNLVETGTGGQSYGWPCYEGDGRTPGYRDLDQCAAEYAKPHTGPVHSYPHDGSRSILGGPTYRGTTYGSDYPDSIFFGDYSGGFIKRLVPNGSGGYVSRDFATDWTGTALEEGPDRNLHFVSVGDFTDGTGSVQRIVRKPNLSPIARIRATTPTAGPAPLTVSFDGRGSTDPENDPLTYDWDFGDGSTHGTGATTSHTFGFGTYTVQLTVSDNRGNSAVDTATVNAGNTPPNVTIQGDSTYRGGESFRLSGSATDTQDGTLSAARLEWDVRLIHAEHTHVGGAGNYPGVNQVEIQAATDHDADSYYEVALKATDTNGASATATRRLNPQTTTVRLRSSPAGAPVSYGGNQLTTPQDLTTAVGFRTTLSVPQSFEQGGQIFNFGSWSDGGARVHDFAVPPGGGTVTANFATLAGQAPGGATPGANGPTDGPAGDDAGPSLRLTGVSARRGRVRGTHQRQPARLRAPRRAT